MLELHSRREVESQLATEAIICRTLNRFVVSEILAQKGPNGFSDEAMALLVAFDWPGNVRQLRSAVERASIVAGGELVEVGDLPPELLRGAKALDRGRQELGKVYLEDVLNQYDGNVSDAASHAGVERESFYPFA